MNDFWSNIILIVLVQGMFTLSLLLLIPAKRKKYENWYLILIILTVFWFLLEFYCIRNRIKIPINIFYGTRYGSWMLLGPLTYFFIKSIPSQWKFDVKDFLHFIPFILFVIVIPFASGESLSNRQIHYGMLAVFDHRPKTVTAFEYLYSTIFYFQFLHFVTYLLVNHFILKKYLRSVKSRHSQMNHTPWLFVFNGFMFLILIFSSAYLYILFASDIYSRSLDYVYVVPMGLFIYAMAYKLSGVEWNKPQEVDLRYSSSNLKPEQQHKLEGALEELMAKKKLFLNNELRLNDLAKELSTSTHHLSQVINVGIGTSFFDYVNKLRIKEAKKIISRNPDYTLLRVAFDAGFNNKTSFVNAFKKFEGTTPSKFRMEIVRRLNSS